MTKQTKLTRNQEREYYIIQRLQRDYREAVHFKLPHATILDRLSKMMESNDYTKLPAYMKYGVLALHTHLFHGPADMSIYQHLEYRMLWTDDNYYTSFDEWRKLFPDADASLIRGGRHFWKGTDKMY